MNATVDTLYIYPVDETYIQLDGDRGLLMDAYDYFSFDVPNAKWTYKFQNKLWDGKVHLLNNITCRIYKGLLPYIEDFAKERDWKIVKDESLFISHAEPFNTNDFCKTLNLTKVPHDFQYEAVQHAVDNERACFESPTSSGKSLIIYCLVIFFLKKFNLKRKILVTEPTSALVEQMLADWKTYSPNFPIEKFVHQIFDGAEKITNKPVIISTWQALQEQPARYMSQFGAIMVDEAHGAKAPELKHILENATDCKYKYGFTGTLDNTESNRLVIEGLTGKAIKMTTTKELMDRGIISELTLQCMILKYSDTVRKQNIKFEWQNETDFIVHHKGRNKFIANLVGALKPKDNILILTEFHDKKKHCDILAEAIKKTCPNKRIIIVHGKTNEDAEELRNLVENNEDIVIIATFGVFSTGRSINNIQHLIFATFSKSHIKVLQSIGRGLRLDGKTNTVYAYDLVDDFGYNGTQNHLVRHFFERIKIYLTEKFKYKIYNINILEPDEL